jgi:hypothetical protein
MKVITSALFFTVIALSSVVFAAGEHDHSPKHGGIVVEVKELDMELVAKPEIIQLYVRDHGKTIKIDGGKAKLTLLTGSEKSDVELPVQGDKFEAKGNFKVAAGTKAVAVVTLTGKPPVTARFAIK